MEPGHAPETVPLGFSCVTYTYSNWHNVKSVVKSSFGFKQVLPIVTSSFSIDFSLSPVKLWLLCKLWKLIWFNKMCFDRSAGFKGFYCLTFCPGLLSDWYEQLWQFPRRHRWTTARWQLWVGLWLLKWQPSVYTNTQSLTLYEEDDDFSAGWTKAAWASWWNILPEVIVLL